MEQNHKYQQFKGQPRLPKFVVPKRYDIRLTPDLAACKFAGAVNISVDVVADTKFIVLNAAELSVDSNSVRFRSGDGSKVLEAKEVELFEEDEILVVEFAQSLPAGAGSLFIAFDGTLNDKMKGFYISTYEHNGKKKNMAVTQFEPADARKCFPRWDEPACKAKEVEEFFTTRTKPSIARTLKQSLERVHINAKWVQSIENEKHLTDAVRELAYSKQEARGFKSLCPPLFLRRGHKFSLLMLVLLLMVLLLIMFPTINFHNSG